MALLKSSKVLDTLKVEGDQKVGVDIVRRAVEAPMRWIATNAGVEGSIVVQKVRDNKDANYGYNAPAGGGPVPRQARDGLSPVEGRRRHGRDQLLPITRLRLPKSLAQQQPPPALH
ncbi:MAG: hypothetical protein AMXMBFR57_35480 [Acidimicrobiia bacterium]